VNSNVNHKDYCKIDEGKQGQISTDHQKFTVYKKHPSSWNRFCGLGLSQHRQLRNFEPKVKSTQQGRLWAFARRTMSLHPEDPHRQPPDDTAQVLKTGGVW